MKNPWFYSQNVFLNAAKGSYSKFLVICTFTNNALAKKSGVAFFDSLIALLQPSVADFLAKFSEWKVSGGEQKGETLTLDNLKLALSKMKINLWDSMIQVVFPKGSPDYVKLLPQGHKLFQRGKTDMRIDAIRNLSKALQNYPALIDLKTDVDDFLGQVDLVRSAQEGEKSEKQCQSYDVKAAMMETGKGMMQVYGQLVYHYAADLKQIEAFFDMRNLRNGLQTVYRGTVKSASMKSVIHRTFLPADKITLTNTGETQLQFYLAKSRTEAPPTTALVLEKGEETLIEIGQLGNIEGSYILAFNADSLNKGHYLLELE